MTTSHPTLSVILILFCPIESKKEEENRVRVWLGKPRSHPVQWSWHKNDIVRLGQKICTRLMLTVLVFQGNISYSPLQNTCLPCPAGPAHSSIVSLESLPCWNGLEVMVINLYYYQSLSSSSSSFVAGSFEEKCVGHVVHDSRKTKLALLKRILPHVLFVVWLYIDILLLIFKILVFLFLYFYL